MSTTEHVEVEGTELEPSLCQFIYPEGHSKQGQQCAGSRYSTGYCAAHTRSMQAREPRQPAPNLSEAAEDLAAKEKMAEISLSANAAAWLSSEKTQKQLRRRWDEIASKGADSELIRLVKELSDRVYGRATEQREEPTVAVPASLLEVRAMSTADRRSLLLDLERKRTG